MRVFVSSTYADLQEHRKAVDQIINRLSAQYSGMEYFGSRPHEPKHVCIEEIGKCQVFIGIYAHRYGWIPDGDSLSITEQEFDYARQAGLDCYCYVVDPTHPWPPPHIEHQASDKLGQFLRKVNNLVRSAFTTPDNLAKQVAADLQAVVNRPLRKLGEGSVLESLSTHCAQEIKSTIGAKYLRELYVGRSLSENLQNAIRRPQRTKPSIRSLSAASRYASDLLKTISTPYPKADQKPLRALLKSLDKVTDGLSGLDQLSLSDERLCYPAHLLHKLLAETRNAILDGQRLNPRRLLTDSDASSRWDGVTSNILTQINSLDSTLRPISLVVDRAGGGKTNLLCRLAEEVGTRNPCFFLAAKSISQPSDRSIVEYLASVYPIGDDPIEIALRAVAIQEVPVVLIVDGINENYDPIGFNAAFKALVRRYYGRPILYVVSCRDIYWNYFEDEWWLSHCNNISRDELYAFTNAEFRNALPLYLRAYEIDAVPVGDAREQLHHPLLLRFYCEAFRGSAERPAQLGRVEDIRLLELFDTYCHRKFSQIRERLHLVSSDEVLSYLRLVGRMMLNSHTRLLPVPKVTQEIKREFNEESVHSMGSLYVQILDEDILLEQKPTGLQMDLMVSFVYDEFMEYIIARSLWSEIYDGKRPSHRKVETLAKTLLKQEDQFISVLGIIIYLGELLAMVSKNDAKKYIDWLVSNGRDSLACKLISRWPRQVLDDAVFQKLIDIHDNCDSLRVKREAWDCMERVCLRHWKIFFSHVTSMQLTGSFRPNIVFSLLGRVGGGPSPEQQLLTVRWIAEFMAENHYISAYRDGGDYKSGVTAMARILKKAKSSWNARQIEEGETLINYLRLH